MWEGTQVEEMPTFKVRDDDVWVCSFPRSGTCMCVKIEGLTRVVISYEIY